MRTKLQAEADALDLELFRMQASIERFIEDQKMSGKQVEPYDRAWSGLNSARSAVRKLMHPADVESTA